MPRLCLLLLLLTVPTFAQSGPSEDMPEMAFMNPDVSVYPDWVRADRVLDAEGKVDSAMFHPPNVDSLERLFKAHPKGKSCMALDEVFVQEGADRIVSFEETVREADWVFVGEITGKAGGFMQHQPGTLLRIEPQEVLRGPLDRTYPHYFFVPAGHIRVGDMALCVTDPVYTVVPKVGTRVLLTVELNWFSKGEFLWGLSDHRIFLQSPSEKARFSPRVTFEDEWLKTDSFDPMAAAEALIEEGSNHEK